MSLLESLGRFLGFKKKQPKKEVVSTSSRRYDSGRPSTAVSTSPQPSVVVVDNSPSLLDPLNPLSPISPLNPVNMMAAESAAVNAPVDECGCGSGCGCNDPSNSMGNSAPVAIDESFSPPAETPTVEQSPNPMPDISLPEITPLPDLTSDPVPSYDSSPSYDSGSSYDSSSSPYDSGSSSYDSGSSSYDSGSSGSSGDSGW